MLCPAISDPFAGPNYRWFAMAHQTALILVFGKIYTLIVYALLKLYAIVFSKNLLDDSVQQNNNFIIETENESSKTK